MVNSIKIPEITEEGDDLLNEVEDPKAQKIEKKTKKHEQKKARKVQKKIRKETKKIIKQERKTAEKSESISLPESTSMYSEFCKMSFSELEEKIIKSETREERAFFRALLNLKLQIEQEKIIGEVLL